MTSISPIHPIERVEIPCLDGILELPKYVLSVTMLNRMIQNNRLTTNMNFKVKTVDDFFAIVIKIENQNYVPDVYECQRYYKLSLLVGYNGFTHQIMRRIDVDLSLFSTDFLENFASGRPDVIHHLVIRLSNDCMHNYRYYPLCVVKEIMSSQLGQIAIRNIRECNNINLFIGQWRLFGQSHFINYVEKTFKKKWTEYYFPRFESILNRLNAKIIQINTYDYIEMWVRCDNGSYAHENVVHQTLSDMIQKYKSITIDTLPTRVIVVDTNEIVW